MNAERSRQRPRFSRLIAVAAVSANRGRNEPEGVRTQDDDAEQEAPKRPNAPIGVAQYRHRVRRESKKPPFPSSRTPNPAMKPPQVRNAVLSHSRNGRGQRGWVDTSVPDILGQKRRAQHQEEHRSRSCPCAWCTSREFRSGWTRAQLTTADNHVAALQLPLVVLLEQ